ncbi:MAG: PTS lactose/cellobiose transporter subunit IIA [Eubacteriaceae bacterium]|jgi:cellobiose-specific phosphotransferase system component IIA
MAELLNGIDEMSIINIITSAGESISFMQQSLNETANQNYDEADKLWEKAGESLSAAHNAHTSILQQEALQNEGASGGSLLVHAQDHLMNAVLCRTLMENLRNMQTTINGLQNEIKELKGDNND